MTGRYTSISGGEPTQKYYVLNDFADRRDVTPVIASEQQPFDCWYGDSSTVYHYDAAGDLLGSEKEFMTADAVPVYVVKSAP